jgi:hypothetical protein
MRNEAGPVPGNTIYSEDGRKGDPEFLFGSTPSPVLQCGRSTSSGKIQTAVQAMFVTESKLSICDAEKMAMFRPD